MLNSRTNQKESVFSHQRKLYLIIVCLVAVTGIFLRIYPSASFKGLGFDENFYQGYVSFLSDVGITNYPKIVEAYIRYQRELPSSVLPPMRFLYIFTSYLWKQIFGVESITALHHVACFFSILTLGISFLFALRLKGKEAGLGVLALMSFAPTQIHMSQHALVDGFFAFWALLTLWSLWENLRQPDHPGWLALYMSSLVLMVMTKENSFFVFVTINGLFILNYGLRFGEITRKLFILTYAGPLLGVTLLITLAGGLENFFTSYLLSVSKNFVLPFAIKTGDGPWYRYLADLMLVSPVILILAIGEVFRLNSEKKPQLFLILFIAFSYLVMCNIKYGMNLRYANMWDMPLRFLAFTQLSTICNHFGQRRALILTLCLMLICFIELRQYYILFVEFPLYELVSEGLLRALRIIK